MKNCKEIIIEKLKELGADGLCGEDCGCGLDDLFPCDNCQTALDCVPAKTIRAPNYHEGINIFVPIEKLEEI